CGSATMIWSSFLWLPGPHICSATICSMSACLETLSEGWAIRSFSVKSLSEWMAGVEPQNVAQAGRSEVLLDELLALHDRGWEVGRAKLLSKPHFSHLGPLRLPPPARAPSTATDKACTVPLGRSLAGARVPRARSLPPGRCLQPPQRAPVASG